MKLVTCLIFLIGLSHSLSGQTPSFSWATAVGSSDFEEFTLSDIDSSGNVYTISHFKDTLIIDFDSSNTVQIPNLGDSDLLITKQDINGNLLWAKSTNSPQCFINCTGMAVSATGNIYMVGGTFGAVDFDPGPGTHLLPFGANFILKLNSNGDFEWARTMVETGVVTTQSIFLDQSEQLYICGQFSGNCDFDLGPAVQTLPSYGLQDVFVLKVDSNGGFVWAKSIGGAGLDYGRDIFTDPSGNVFVTGDYKQTVDFDPGPATFFLTPSGVINDMYVLKLDVNGDFVWAVSTQAQYEIFGRAISVDNIGNILVTGSFRGDVDFDPGPAVHIESPSAGHELFILKLNDIGEFDWVRTKTISGNGRGYDVIADNSNNVYATGYAVGDILVKKLRADGTLIFEFIIDNPSLAESGTGKSLAIDAQSNLYISGEFFGTQDFDPNPAVFSLTSKGETDVFVCKIEQCNPFEIIPDINPLADLTGGCFIAQPASPSGMDNCGAVFTGVANTAFPITTPGTTIITWTYYGDNGVVYTQTQNAYITGDPMPDPILGVLPTINADTCFVDISQPEARVGCSTVILGTPDVSLPITTVGHTEVTWTYDAGNGFTTTQKQDVFLARTIPPVKDITNLSVLSSHCEIKAPDPPTATDDCDGTIYGVPNLVFPITDQSIDEVIWTYTDSDGNSSTQTQIVFWSNFDLYVYVTGYPPPGLLSGNSSNIGHQWLDCDNNYAIIPGETNTIFEPSVYGTYAVEFTSYDGYCIDTSICRVFDPLSVNNEVLETKFKLFPNPTTGDLYLEFEKEIQEIQLTLFDVTGKEIISTMIDNKRLLKLELNPVSGVYLLKLTDKEGRFVTRRILLDSD